ncbi:MAG TPA: hypothetical protein PLL30_10735 [Candidatus Krumholzibacteria bacterium]|nr:hypothetical protein [Candidatus Krumholzibacteria bacterium]HPD72239.1 hypothetical protein [Candidatus Krumholzibacteria bacterium]HRY40829.1 hypothetical protein [Candidatus Krumholzibacteria bacterium]
MNTRLAWPALVVSICVGGAVRAQPSPDPASGASAARPDSATFLAVRTADRESGLVPDEAALRDQVREPLFAFVFTMVARDSLGTWTAADVAAFAESWGQASDFPLEQHLDRLTRESPPAGEFASRRDLTCDRRWVIRLRPERVEVPMPYSILGYHPGRLSVQSPLELREWRLGDRSVHVTVGGETSQSAVSGLTIFEIVHGWIILDVDGWLDTLLGRAADDAVSEGFAVGWVGAELVGIGTSGGRDGRRIVGELDLRTGEIENHGRPLALGLGQFCRAWIRGQGADPREAWRAYGR